MVTVPRSGWVNRCLQPTKVKFKNFGGGMAGKFCRAANQRPPLNPALCLGRFLDVAQTSGFALQSAKVEQPCTPYLRRTQQINLVNHLGVDGKDMLHTLSKADLPNREAG